MLLRPACSDGVDSMSPYRGRAMITVTKQLWKLNWHTMIYTHAVVGMHSGCVSHCMHAMYMSCAWSVCPLACRSGSRKIQYFTSPWSRSTCAHIHFAVRRMSRSMLTNDRWRCRKYKVCRYFWEQNRRSTPFPKRLLLISNKILIFKDNPSHR